MDGRTTNSTLGITGRIERQTHSIDALRDSVNSWDSLSKEEKLAASREVQPIESDEVFNVTTEELHKYFVRNLDPDNSSPEADVSLAWLGLGIDATAGTSTTDTDLNNRTYEETVTDVADDGATILASTFIDSNEANGNDFDEIGLFSGDPNNLSDPDVFLINHATFATVTKDNSKTVTFDVSLNFSDN